MIDLDIRSCFDSLDHSLVLRTVSKHTDLGWVLLYIERWLTAPLQREDGTLVTREVVIVDTHGVSDRWVL